MSKENRTFYIETYGCQMNVADSELIASVLQSHEYMLTKEIKEAGVILINTCSIRDHAEQRVFSRLDYFNALKKKNPKIKIGLVGCMAERLKEDVLSRKPFIDLVVGPDAYRNLPPMLETVDSGQKAINVILSKEENYDNILPVHYHSNHISAFITIMRGCDNMCAYCVVPFTRGRERSRSHKEILNELDVLIKEGYKEVTLIGQNVDKYYFKDHNIAIDFADLLEIVALRAPELRIRFSTSYPQNFTEKVVMVMAKYPNICRYIHLPIQSGSNHVLEQMKRGYTREWYLDRIAMIRKHLPDCAISTDIIAGFCNETDEGHHHTLNMMKTVNFDFAYMFMYSERPGTYAAKKIKDDVPSEVKKQRLSEIIELQNMLSHNSNKKDVGKTFEILVEGTSKRSDEFLYGRNSQNKVIIFKADKSLIGQFVKVSVNNYTQATLLGELVD